MGEVKVIVIALDGASFDVFSSLAEEGTLTNIRRLMKEGCFGVLRSTIPPISPAAFSSLITGKNPGKHGVFSFGHFKDGFFTPYTSTCIKGEALWDILSTIDKKSILLNVPLTFPPYEINGIMISGFPAQRLFETTSYPSDLISFLRSKIGDYHVDIQYLKSDYEGIHEKKFLDEAYYVTQKRVEAMQFLMENYDWDFFMMVETSLDRIQHLLFGYFDKESPYYDEEKREVLIKYYKKIDSILGKIVSLIDENAILIVVSDHGFEPLYKYVGINNLLVQGGFTKNVWKFQTSASKWMVKILKFLEGKGIKTYKFLSSNMILKVKNEISLRYDFASSKAYSASGLSIFINKHFKDKTYESIKRRLTEFLYSVIDEENGERIVEKIYNKDEIYWGNHLNDAPDLTIVLKKGYEPKAFRNCIIENLSQVNRKVKRGTHAGFSAQRGLFIISGRGVKKGSLTEVNIVDIAPTIMYILGAPIPSDTDGRVLREIFEPDSKFAKEPITYEEVTVKKKEETLQLSKGREAIIEERLRKLGYI